MSEQASNIGDESLSFQSQSSFQPPFEGIKTELHTIVDKLQRDEPSGEPPRRPLWQQVLIWQIPIWLVAFLIVLSYNPRVDSCGGVKINYKTQTLCIANDNDFFLFVEHFTCDFIEKGTIINDSIKMDSVASQVFASYYSKHNIFIKDLTTEKEILTSMRNARYDTTSFCHNVAVAYWNAGVRLLNEGEKDSACVYFNKLEQWKGADSVLKTDDLQQIQKICPQIFPEDVDYEPFQQNGKFGYRHDKTRVLIITPQYENAYFFLEGLGAVKQKGKWGFIDKNNSFIIEPQFDNVITRFHNGIARVMIGQKEFCIDKLGNEVDCTLRNQIPKTPFQNKQEPIKAQPNSQQLNLKTQTTTPSVTWGKKPIPPPILLTQNINLFDKIECRGCCIELTKTDTIIFRNFFVENDGSITISDSSSVSILDNKCRQGVLDAFRKNCKFSIPLNGRYEYKSFSFWFSL